jgi:hypothetical protein
MSGGTIEVPEGGVVVGRWLIQTTTFSLDLLFCYSKKPIF